MIGIRKLRQRFGLWPTLQVVAERIFPPPVREPMPATDGPKSAVKLVYSLTSFALNLSTESSELCISGRLRLFC